MRKALVVLAALLAAVPATASAQQRAFVLTGSESEFTPNDPVVGAMALLPNGDIAVMRVNGRVRILDALGRSRALATVPGEGTYPGTLALTPDGTALIAVGGGRLWRVGLDGTTVALTPVPRRREQEVRAAAVLADDSILISRWTTISRRAPDGRETRVAGNGREGSPRPGPALRSPFEFATAVASTPDGGFMIGSPGEIWRVDARGAMRRLAGGGPVAADAIPPGGRRAIGAALGDVYALGGDPAGEVVAVTTNGLLTVRGGILRQVVEAGFEPAEPRPPLWSGDLVARAWLQVSGGVARTANGGWLVATLTGVTLLTDAQGHSARLAVAIDTATQATAADGAVRIVSTRPATVRVRAHAGGQRVTETTAPVEAGTTVVRLPRPLPPGPVTLTARATAPDRAVAGHSLVVLGTREVPLDLARRALRDDAGVSRTFVTVRGCRREGGTRVSCVSSILDQDEGTVTRRRLAVTLRRDGWLWVSGKGARARRVELRAPSP